MLRACLLPTLVAAVATAASAQTIEIRPNRPSVEMPSTVEPVRITLGVNMFMHAPNDDSEQALKAQEAARRMIYDLAGHECAILRDVLATECRLESINVNVQRVPGNQFGAQQQKVEGFNVNGNIGFRIAPK
jgi:hypothetical protein